MSIISTLFLVVLVAFSIIIQSCHGRRMAESEKLLLTHVKALTLRAGDWTEARRGDPIPQLKCTSGCQLMPNLPKFVQCINVGTNDQAEVQWKCEADLVQGVRFGELTVSCEGYDNSEDSYILKGSCGLEYSLESDAPQKQQQQQTIVHKVVEQHQTPNYSYTSDLLAAFVLCVIIVSIVACVALTSETRAGGRNNGPINVSHPSSSMHYTPLPPAPMPYAPFPPMSYAPPPTYSTYHYRDDSNVGSFVNGMAFQRAMSAPDSRTKCAPTTSGNTTTTTTTTTTIAAKPSSPVTTTKTGFAKTVKR